MEEADGKELVADLNLREPVPWKITDVAIATVLVFLGFFILLILLWLAFEVTGIEDEAILTPWVAAVLGLLMLSAAWTFGVKRYNATWQALGLRRPQATRSFTMPWIALMGSLLFTGLYAATVSALGLEALEPPPIEEDLLGRGGIRALNSVIIAGWAPFAEEVFFRGFILAALVSPLGVVRAAVVGSTVFAAAHVDPGTLVPIFVTGLLLSWLYLRSRSIWPPLIAHMAQNLIAVSVV
jgi:hypothetical protein